MSDTRDGRDIVERLRALSNSIGDEAADIIEVHSNSIDALVAGWNNDRAELIRLRSQRVAVPEGWRRKLDDDDLETITIVARNGQSGRITQHEVDALVEAYRLLAAAPQPPTVEAGAGSRAHGGDDGQE